MFKYLWNESSGMWIPYLTALMPVGKWFMKYKCLPFEFIPGSSQCGMFMYIRQMCT